MFVAVISLISTFLLKELVRGINFASMLTKESVDPNIQRDLMGGQTQC